jgi:curli biogenesis system outer membrane secretion channel CsgG
MARQRAHTVAQILAMLALAGCAQAAGHKETLQGPAPKAFMQSEPSPYARYLACVKDALPRQQTVRIGIGRVADATGKFNLDNGTGRFVTQGATDQLYTMLHLPERDGLVERAQTQVLQWERQMGAITQTSAGTEDRTVLKRVNGGDGQSMTRDDLVNQLSPDLRRKVRSGEITMNDLDMKNQEGKPLIVRDDGVFVKSDIKVPATAVQSSDYFIVGSINRLDTTTNSGDVTFRVAGLGPRARGFALQVGLDLRAVNTNNSVVDTVVSVDKMVIGHEYGFGVGRIFGTTLVEIDAAGKQVEPLQTEALKGMLQYASGQLLAQLYEMEVPAKCREPLQELDGYELVPEASSEQVASN